MGCGGGGGTQTQVTKQELDPEMRAMLYGSGSDPGLYKRASNMFLNRTPEQSVAGFNPLQQFAMQQTANLAMNPNFGGQQTTHDVVQKLMKRGGVDYQRPSFSMPAFDTSLMFAKPQGQQVQISPDAVKPPQISAIGMQSPNASTGAFNLVRNMVVRGAR